VTVNEIQSQLRTAGSVTLDGNGNGVIIFDTNSANQRWEVTSITVKTNQPANATTVPVAQIALNTTDVSTMSDGNNRGATWSGNQDIFQGTVDVGPVDFLSVIFGPPPGTGTSQSSPGSVTLPGPQTWPSGSLYPGAISGGTPGGGSVLAGVIGSAVVLGTKYTFRGYT
jgi:hypothetical protein